MKKILVEESLFEFAKRGRPKKNAVKKTKRSARNIDGIDSTDSWGDEDEEVADDIDIDTSDMSDAEEIEIEDNAFDSELLKVLNNEIKIPEFNRRIVKFKVKGDLKHIVMGIPMAKLGQNAFLFKLRDGSMKKYYLKDMILESQNFNNKNINETYEENLEDSDIEEDDNYCELCGFELDEDGECQICGGEGLGNMIKAGRRHIE